MLIRKKLKIANDQRFFLYNVDIPLMDDSALDEAYRQLLQGVKKPLDPLSAVGDVVHGLLLGHCVNAPGVDTAQRKV